MKRLTFSSIVLTAILLGSCAPVTAIPAPTATMISTITPLPTSSPTSTTIPSATPYPTLHTQGPYLLFTNDHKSLTLMDADGSGRKQIQLPNDGHIYSGDPLKYAVSPDGKWIVYFTGSKAEPYNFVINLLNLKNETTLLVANLIAPGFPQNLEPVAQALPSEICSGEGCLSLAENAFYIGIQAFDWSPDGKHLAFAAQIDGPSSDIYVYSLENNSIQRITKDIQNVYWIEWSPKGNKILYANSIPGTNYIGETLHVADFNNLTLQDPKPLYSGYFWYGAGWIDEDIYVIWNGGEGAPPNNFQSINIETNQVKSLWEYISESYILLPSKEGMVFVLYQQQIDTDKIPLSAGTYFVSISGKRTKLSDEVYFPLQFQGNLTDSFLAIQGNINIRLYLFNVDDSNIRLVAENVNLRTTPSVSPDKKWILLETDAGTSLYSNDLQLAKTWDIRAPEIAWRSDSLGLFWRLHNKGLYYISIPGGEPVWLSDCKAEDCPNFSSGVWLP